MKFFILSILWTVFMSYGVLCQNYRLPQNIRPTIYELELTLNPEQDDFKGTVKINLAVYQNQPADTISLHYSFRDIKITNIQLNKDIKCTKISELSDKDMAKFRCDSDIKTGDWLTINYQSKYETGSSGLYKKTYKEACKKQTYLTTYLQPVYARKLFPCFDEPSFKAKFSVTVIHPKNYRVLANTPIADNNYIGSNIMKTVFETTPVMSSYLLALSVSQFEQLLSTHADGYFNTYTRSSMKKYIGTITKYGTTITNTMNLWTKINYVEMGVKQMNLVVVPDFLDFAMENWGLIFFSEEFIFDDEEKTSLSMKDKIILYLAHEIAHQWFGNYVTFCWWSDAWLNEGFATYFSIYIKSKIFSSNGETDKQFLSQVLMVAFNADEKPEANPLSRLEKDVEKPRDIDKSLNDIAYYKGASIIRMMKYLLGDEVFQKAMTSYLTDRKYDCSTTELLLNHLEKTPGNKINAFSLKMKAWLYETGYPLVTAKWDKSAFKIILSQENFNREVKTQWYIPINYQTSYQKMSDFIWLGPHSTLDIPVRNNLWIIFNLRVFGYYRVKYDSELLHNIIVALKGNDRYNIDPFNRAQLISDVFKIAEIGKTTYEDAFALLDYLKYETDYYPWEAASTLVSNLFKRIDYESQDLLKKRILEYINNDYNKILSYKDDNSHIYKLKNALITELACKVDQQKCIKYAKEEFQYYKKTENLHDYNNRDVIFCTAIKHSEDIRKDYDFLLNIFKKSTSPVEKKVILNALACMSDKKYILKYLQNPFSYWSSIGKEYAATVFLAVLSSGQVGLDVSLELLSKNFNKINKKLRDSAGIINALTEVVVTVEQINKLENIIKSSTSFALILQYDEMLKELDIKKEWSSKYGNQIKNILKRRLS